MHNAKENSIELDQINRMSKINFQNMTIFTSYPMYLDALDTYINLNKMLRLAQLDTTAARIFGIYIFVGVSTKV